MVRNRQFTVTVALAGCTISITGCSLFTRTLTETKNTQTDTVRKMTKRVEGMTPEGPVGYTETVYETIVSKERATLEQSVEVKVPVVGALANMSGALATGGTGCLLTAAALKAAQVMWNRDPNKGQANASKAADTE